MTIDESLAPQDGFALRLNKLDKTYGGRKGKLGKHALQSMTLDIPRGCIFGLLGPNGAGKSTLINILAGTVVKSSGSASIWGGWISMPTPANPAPISALCLKN